MLARNGMYIIIDNHSQDSTVKTNPTQVRQAVLLRHARAGAGGLTQQAAELCGLDVGMAGWQTCSGTAGLPGGSMVQSKVGRLMQVIQLCGPGVVGRPAALACQVAP